MIDDNELSEIYQSLVLDHSKKPLNFGVIDGVLPIKGKNPSCGDQIDLYVVLDDNKISNIKFKGEGCALCIASSSLMTKTLKGKNIEDAQSILEKFSQLLHGTTQSMENEEYEVLDIFKHVHTFPSRVKCAMLGWRALETSLEQKSDRKI